MPELPEVETVRRALEMTLPGRTITDICVRESRLRFAVDESQLTDLILRRKVVRLARRAKYLIIHFTKGSCLIVHLGMTGQVLILPAATPLDKHDHVIFTLNNGWEMRFRDPRRFGCIIEIGRASCREREK